MAVAALNAGATDVAAVVRAVTRAAKSDVRTDANDGADGTASPIGGKSGPTENELEKARVALKLDGYEDCEDIIAACVETGAKSATDIVERVRETNAKFELMTEWFVIRGFAENSAEAITSAFMAIGLQSESELNTLEKSLISLRDNPKSSKLNALARDSTLLERCTNKLVEAGFPKGIAGLLAITELGNGAVSEEEVVKAAKNAASAEEWHNVVDPVKNVRQP